MARLVKKAKLQRSQHPKGDKGEGALAWGDLRRRKPNRAGLLTSTSPCALLLSEYLDCFSLSPAGHKGFVGLTEVCPQQETEALQRNCSLFALLIADSFRRIHQCLREGGPLPPFEKLRAGYLACGPGSGGVHRTEQSREFLKLIGYASKPLNTFVFFSILLLTCVIPMLRSYGKIVLSSSSMWGCECEQFVDEARLFFESMPPHPDAVAVRLLTTMLLEGLSCPKNSSFGRDATVLVDGKPKKVKVQQVLEASIILFIEALFDARDCVNDPSKADDPTCRLLNDYDRFRMKGRKAFQEGQGDDTSDTQGGGLGALSAEEGQAGMQEEGEAFTAVESDGDGTADLSSGDSNASGADLQSFSELPESSEGGMSDPSAHRGNDEESQRSARIMDYVARAASNAVGYARLIKLLQGAMGRNVLSTSGFSSLAKSGKRGELIIVVYVRALIHLLTGDSSLAQISANVVSTVAREGSQKAQQKGGKVTAFVQGDSVAAAEELPAERKGSKGSKKRAIIFLIVDIIIVAGLLAATPFFPTYLTVAVIIFTVIAALLHVVQFYAVYRSGGESSGSNITDEE
ncbi:hypothetical protein ACSSS7_001521 [Eimeria intestinalis]